MQLLEGELVLSASDLTGFAACEHLTQLELSVVRGERTRATRDDPMLDVLSARGTEHELKHLARLKEQGLDVAEIPDGYRTRADLRAAQDATVEAMRQGADAIYQATFFTETPGQAHWRGHADFLYRVDTPSDLGDWSYEVADTKLARRVKAAAILQMCAYSEQLAGLQGVTPAQVHVITGDGESHPFRLADYSAYHRHLKARYEALVAEAVAGHPRATYPDPVDHCGICRWADECKDRRRADDHLSLVSGLRRDQVHKLDALGVTTRVELAKAPDDLRVPGMAEPTVARLHHQARLQVEGEGAHPPIYELLAPEAPDPDDPLQRWPQRGWAALPEPSPGDLFFDMEGDPYALDDSTETGLGDTGLEYLFGVIELDAPIDDGHGKPSYRSFWAHSRAEEKTAFERFIDFVMAQRERHPDLHVYHYAPYEPSAMKRLMGSHHTREQQVDELLRGEVFVDLYAVVRQGVRIGSESYSLKKVEQLYMERLPGDVMDGGGSIVAYEAYLDDHAQHRLDEIERYNEDDCRSTLGLRDWLEARRAEAEAQFGPIPRPDPKGGEASEQLTAREEQARHLAEQLCAGVPLARDERDDEQRARWLLAQMLEWHRREDKADWWSYYARRHMSDDELLDDRECISGLELVGEVGRVKQSAVCRYGFSPQDHKFKVGDTPDDPFTGGGAGEVVAVDDLGGTIDLKRGPKVMAGPHPRALMPSGPIPSVVIEGAIRRLAEHVVTHGIAGPGPYQSARDLLLRTQRDRSDGPFATTYLAIQGPPGSGKTHRGAELILDLVEEGKRVGVTAHSHAVIGNLLHKVCELADERGVKVRALQKAKEHQQCSAPIVECTDDNGVVAVAAVSGDYDVIAGTSWLWAREAMAGSVDVLFVDEAGQKSLADVLAVSGAAAQLVLLGDPQQLAQPSKGSHPEGAEVSALEHLLAGRATMPPELGWFLDETWRMHPAVCAFVSEIAYEGRLHSRPGLERQAVEGFAGLRFVPVEAQGNRSWSAEEVEKVSELVRSLVGKQWTNKKGKSRKLKIDDILVVTPYNAQVAKLAAALPDGARIGTVDKFQGQEAPVTVYSMATSSADDVPRSMEFLYDLHRFNVAVSRAKAESIVVCSPKLLDASCRKPVQMKLVNALCAYSEARSRGDSL